MRDTRDLQRVLCEHGWTDPAEWASALDDLSTLTDGQIARLARSARWRARPDGRCGR